MQTLNPVETMDYLCRKLIILSIIYYDFNDNIVTDQEYDKVAKRLDTMVKMNKKRLPECYYYEILKDYTPATGFDMKYKLTEEHRKYLEHIANYVLYTYRGEKVDAGRKAPIDK